MKFLLFFFLMLTASATVAGNAGYDVVDLRKQYLAASTDSEAGKRFYDLMSDYKDKDPVVLAYKAVSEATMAKYVWNPYSKLKHLKESAAIFDKAVQLDNDNPEIRFLRFTVEHYVPRYLNLSPHLEADKKIIISSLTAYKKSGLSASWARTMRDFMLTKDHCTEEEKALLQNLTI
ncbi:hypothetical protein [Botryobacter ruber]|uniref:hypothetical protein n=1 Tax=Botryobacter ruber TaxID=2171629 RepID=UPI000E0BE440|nr:hypothetical protein [Botryobacter ruber]